MSENTKPVTDASFATDVLKADGAGAGGFLGGMVRPVPRDRPGAGGDRRPNMAGKLTIAKVNIDENPRTPNDYHVRGIPTLILFKDGKPVATQVGAAPKSALKHWIARSL